MTPNVDTQALLRSILEDQPLSQVQALATPSSPSSASSTAVPLSPHQTPDDNDFVLPPPQNPDQPTTTTTTDNIPPPHRPRSPPTPPPPPPSPSHRSSLTINLCPSARGPSIADAARAGTAVLLAVQRLNAAAAMRASFLGVAREGRAGPPRELPGVDVVVNVGVARAGRGRAGPVMVGVRRKGSFEDGMEGKRRRVGDV